MPEAAWQAYSGTRRAHQQVACGKPPPSLPRALFRALSRGPKAGGPWGSRSVHPATPLAPRAQDVTSEFTLGKVLGRGQFGTTRLAEKKGDKKTFACKSIAKRKLT